MTKTILILLSSIVLASAAPPPQVQHNLFTTNRTGTPVLGPAVFTNSTSGGSSMTAYGSLTVTNPSSAIAIDAPVGLIRSQDPVNGALNVRSYGAVGDGSTDDTLAFQAACNAASNKVCAIYVPAGNYVISSIDVTGVTKIQGESGIYGYASALKHKLGATDDMIVCRGNPVWRPILRDLYLEGKREQNLRNMRTITAVGTRTTFTVNAAPPSGYDREVFFFYSDVNGYHYLGSGIVASISGNDVTLQSYGDWFATPTGAGNKLTTNCVACFGQESTEPVVGSIQDPTRAGYCAIDLPSGAYLMLHNIRIQNFHCGIRHGPGPAIEAQGVFMSGLSLAGMYYPYASGSDDRFDNFELGGGYFRDPGMAATSQTFDNELYRSTKYGLFLRGTSLHFATVQIYQCINNVFASGTSWWGICDLDSSIRDSLVVDYGADVSFGSLHASVVGKLQTSTFSAILNVGGNCSIGSFQSELTSANIKAASIVYNTSTNCHTYFGRFKTLTGIATDTGYPIIETTDDGKSYVDGYSMGSDLVAGRLGQGAVLVYHNKAAMWGAKFLGDGSGGDPFRLALITGDGSAPQVSFLQNGALGLGKVANTNYMLDVLGDTACQKAIQILNRYPELRGIDIPALNVNGPQWFATTNGAGESVMAAKYPNDKKVYIPDATGTLHVDYIHADAGTGPTFTDRPVFTDGFVFNGTTYTDSLGGGTPGGGDTQVQFNDAGAFAGDSYFLHNKISHVTTVAGIKITSLESNRFMVMTPAGMTNLPALADGEVWIGDSASTFGVKATNAPMASAKRGYFPTFLRPNGATVKGTNDPATYNPYEGLPFFSGTSDAIAAFFVQVPEDLDTSTNAMKLERLTMSSTGGADTGVHRYTLSWYDYPESSNLDQTPAHTITFDKDLSAASIAWKDFWDITNVDLTDWETDMVPGRTAVIVLTRLASNGADTSTVQSAMITMRLSYQSTQ